MRCCCRAGHLRAVVPGTSEPCWLPGVDLREARAVLPHPPSLHNCCRGMPCLRQLDLFGVLLTRDLGSTIIGLGHIADVRLNLAFNTHYEDAWGLLAQLGGRLSCLGLVLDWMGLEPAGDPPPDEDEELEELRLPAGLLALTQLGRFDLQLLEFGGTRVEGLERMPLQRFDTNGYLRGACVALHPAYRALLYGRLSVTAPFRPDHAAPAALTRAVRAWAS